MLRVFPEAERLLHLSLLDTGFELLLVSQFTILSDCRKEPAAPPSMRRRLRELAERLYQELAARLSDHGLRVATGRFAR